MSRGDLPKGLRTFRPRGHARLTVLDVASKEFLLQAFRQLKTASKLSLDPQDTLSYHGENMLGAMRGQNIDVERLRQSSRPFINRQREILSVNKSSAMADSKLSEIKWQEYLRQLAVESEQLKLARMKSRWEKIALFAECSTAVLIYLTKVVIPLLEDYIEISEIELKMHPERLSDIDNGRYRLYLKDFTQALADVKSRVMDTIFEKLRFCSEHECVGDLNLVASTLSQVHSMTKTESPIDKSLLVPRPIELSDFTYLHRYIESEGKKHHLEGMKRFKWLQNEGEFVRCVIQGKFVVVPKGIERHVPSEKWWNKWFSRLHPDCNFVRDLFKDKLVLTAQIKSLDKLKIRIDGKPLSESHDHQHLEALSKQLSKDASSSTTLRKKGPYKYIFKRRDCVLDRWNTVLMQSQEKIVSLKVDLLEKAYSNLKTRQLMEQVEQIQICQKLVHDLLLNIERGIHKFGISSQDLERVQAIKYEFETRMRPGDILVEDKIDKLLSEIVDDHGSIKGDGHIRLLYGYYRNISCRDTPRLNYFHNRCFSAITAVLRNLRVIFHSFIEQQEAPGVDTSKQILRGIEFVNTFGDDLDKSQILRLLKGLEGSYLRSARQGNIDHNDSNYLKFIEKLQLSFGSPEMVEFSRMMNAHRTAEEYDNEVFVSLCDDKYVLFVERQEQRRVEQDLVSLDTRFRTFLAEKVKYSSDKMDPILSLVTRHVEEERYLIERDDLNPQTRGLINPSSRNYSLRPLINAYLHAVEATKARNPAEIASALQELDRCESDIKSSRLSKLLTSFRSSAHGIPEPEVVHGEPLVAIQVRG